MDSNDFSWAFRPQYLVRAGRKSRGSVIEVKRRKWNKDAVRSSRGDNNIIITSRERSNVWTNVRVRWQHGENVQRCVMELSTCIMRRVRARPVIADLLFRRKIDDTGRSDNILCWTCSKDSTAHKKHRYLQHNNTPRGRVHGFVFFFFVNIFARP